jgi:hypothetical protein
VDALEHYQRALEGLREYGNLESCNSIYTHYFYMIVRHKTLVGHVDCWEKLENVLDLILERR